MRGFVVGALSLIFLLDPCVAQDKESFRQLLKILIQRDPEFREVDLQTPVARAQVMQATSQLVLPKVYLSYGQQQQKNNVSLATAVDKFQLASATASFDLFSFGADWQNFQAAKYGICALEKRVESQLLRREMDLSSLIFDYLRAKENFEILKRIVELKERSADVSRAMFKRGTLSAQDFDKVRLDLSNATGELLSTQQEFTTALARVRAYGIENLPEAYPWKSDLHPQRLEEIQALSSPVDDLPQFQEVRLSQIAADHRTSAALSSMLGKIQLNFARSYYRFPEQGVWEWRTSLTYTLPLFDQFDQYALYVRNRATQETARVREEFRQHQALRSQEADRLNLEAAWKNWLQRKEALKISDRLYKDSLKQFNQGKLSVNELFVDQDRLLRTELIANGALYQLHSAVLAFCHSRGRSFIKGCF